MKSSCVTLVFAMAFFVSAIGAKDCGLGKIGESQIAPKPADPPSDKPFCMVDPPADCVAYCLDVDYVDFTLGCGDPGSGPITALFKENVYEYVQLLHGEGMQACAEPGTLYGAEALIAGEFVTPCSIGYTPQLYKDQSLEACTPPPSWCN